MTALSSELAKHFSRNRQSNTVFDGSEHATMMASG